MIPDAKGWRIASNYEHVGEISASDLAWEWLRRNKSYQDDYAELVRAQSGADLNAGLGTDNSVEDLTERIRKRWRLQFCC